MSIEYLDKQADIPQRLQDKYVSNLMYLIWSSRRDLQVAFDLRTVEGQQGLIQWYEVSVFREYGMTPQTNGKNPGAAFNGGAAKKSPQIRLHTWMRRLEGALVPIGKRMPAPIRETGKTFWSHIFTLLARSVEHIYSHALFNRRTQSEVQTDDDINGHLGANLIGYVNAELGMGEHVRMSAAAFDTTDIKFGVLNFNVAVVSRQEASLDCGRLITGNVYRANIFHINADQMVNAYCYLGRSFFVNRYNIGYWAWELEKCPDALRPMIEMVDEIWAPSRFIQSSFAEKTSKPVEYMPLCVTIPPFKARRRTDFGLPENHFLFLFAFDFLSHIDRKNPFAAIWAFQMAFPDRSTPVGLVIKIMNGDIKNPQWMKMMAAIGDDTRIHVINRTMCRGDVLALIDSCNSFLSLHRSEGFGRGPAEAMLLGKPVIVTNYSGNTDFTRPENSCLVDYRLIPVEAGQYLFEEGQVWADVDIEHAAWHMRRLFEDTTFATEIALRGQEFIRANFNPSVIGGIYAKRLKDLRVA